jgi:hypothetical protein
MGRRVQLPGSGASMPRSRGGRADHRDLEDVADSLHQLPSAAEDLQVIIPRRDRTLFLQRGFCISLAV